MKANLNMVIDRTADDVKQAFELRKKIQSKETLTADETVIFERGALTLSTLTRISLAYKAVADILNGYGYYTGDTSHPSSWSKTEKLYNNLYMGFLNDCKHLLNAFWGNESTPDPPNYLFGFNEVNAIEQIAVDVNDKIPDMEGSFKFCGEINCGEGVLFQ